MRRGGREVGKQDNFFFLPEELGKIFDLCPLNFQLFFPRGKPDLLPSPLPTSPWLWAINDLPKLKIGTHLGSSPSEFSKETA